jgi:hypothetical protein
MVEPVKEPGQSIDPDDPPSYDLACPKCGVVFETLWGGVTRPRLEASRAKRGHHRQHGGFREAEAGQEGIFSVVKEDEDWSSRWSKLNLDFGKATPTH